MITFRITVYNHRTGESEVTIAEYDLIDGGINLTT